MNTALSILGLLVCASGSFWVWLLARRMAGEPVLAMRPRRDGVWSPFATVIALAWVGLQVAGQVYASTQGDSDAPSPDSIRGVFLVSMGVFAFLLASLTLPSQGSFGDFGIGLSEDLGDGAVALVGFIAALAPTYLLIYLTTDFRSEESQHEFLKALGDSPTPSTVMWIVLAALVSAPLVEELLFRVVFQRALLQLVSPGVAIVTTAVLFCALHGWPDSLPLLPLALILGYIYHRRNSYFSVVVLHACFNTLNLLLALTARDFVPTD